MKTALVVGVAALLATGSLAAAAGAAGDGGRMLERLDLDGDGAVSRDEARAFGDERFQRWDSDSDGIVTEAEMIKAAQERIAARVGKMFARMDRNGDGRLERAELDAMGSARFERMDADGDGRISVEEIRARWRGRHGGMGGGAPEN